MAGFFDIGIYTYYNCGMYVYLIATKKRQLNNIKTLNKNGDN